MIAEFHEIARRIKDSPLHVGYTSGVFDLFHQGHKSYLHGCRAKCEFLVVGVDVDWLVKKMKGGTRPINSELIRANSVLATGVADAIFLKDCSAAQLLPILRPRKYFIPSNRTLQQSRIQLLNDLGIEIDVIGYTEEISTTALIQQFVAEDTVR